MNICVAVPLYIKQGIGELHFPEVFKRAPLQVNIGCNSMYFSPVLTTKDEPCCIICSGSYYYSAKHELKPNILGMFQNKKKINIVNFTQKFPISSAQEILQIEIVDFNYKRKDISSIAVFHFEGAVSNRHLAI